MLEEVGAVVFLDQALQLVEARAVGGLELILVVEIQLPLGLQTQAAAAVVVQVAVEMLARAAPA